METTRLTKDSSSERVVKPRGLLTDSNINNIYKQPAEEETSTSLQSPTCLNVWPQILSSLIAFSTVIQLGINLAYSGVLIPQLAEDPNIKEFTKDQASWIASLVPIAQPFGALAVGPMMDFIGRKKTCMVTNIPIITCWTIIFFTTHSVWPIYVARVLAGFSSGMGAFGVVYTAEISHAKFRPILLSINSINVAFGILIVTLIGPYMEWHMSAIFYGSLALVSFILSFFIPESPYWLAGFTNASTEKIKSQVEYLNRTKWLVDEEWAVIQRIMDEKKKGIVQERGASRFVQRFCERSSYLPVLILIVVFILQHTSGTFVVIFYSVNIFKSVGDFGNGFDAYTATTTLGILRFFTSCLLSVLIRKLGRRTLLIISSSGMALSCILSAIFLKLNNISTIKFDSYNLTSIIVPPNNTSGISTIEENPVTSHPVINNWWILISLLGYVFAGALGQMSIPWTLMSEILPTKIRGSGSGMLVAFASLVLFSVIKSFPFLVDLITLPYVFVCYGVISIIAVNYTYFCIPETLGKKFDEIAKYFEKKN